MTLLSAKAFGATRVAITDIAENRLAIAREIGADLTINVKDKSTEDVIAILKDKMGELPEMAVECVGFPPSVELSIKVSFPFPNTSSLNSNEIPLLLRKVPKYW